MILSESEYRALLVRTIQDLLCGYKISQELSQNLTEFYEIYPDGCDSKKKFDLDKIDVHESAIIVVHLWLGLLKKEVNAVLTTIDDSEKDFYADQIVRETVWVYEFERILQEIEGYPLRKYAS